MATNLSGIANAQSHDLPRPFAVRHLVFFITAGSSQWPRVASMHEWSKSGAQVSIFAPMAGIYNGLGLSVLACFPGYIGYYLACGSRIRMR